MSDLGTNQYYINHHPGNQRAVGYGLSDTHIDSAKTRATKNPVGKVVDDFSGSKQAKSPLDILTSFLYGASAVLGISRINSWLTGTDTAKNSRLAKSYTKLDNQAQKGFLAPVNKFFNSIGDKIKNNSVVKHFSKHSEKVSPVNNFARQSSRTIQGEITEQLVEKTESLYKKQGEKPFKQLLLKAETGASTYKEVAEQALQKINGINPNITELSEKTQRSYTKALQNFEKAKSAGNEKQIARAAKKFMKKAAKTMGEYEARGAKAFLESYKMGTITQGQAYKGAVEKLAKLADVKNIKNVINKSDMDNATKTVLKVLKAKGFSEIDDIAIKANKINLLGRKAGTSVLSKAAKGLYKMSNRAFRSSDFIGMFFIGDVIRKTTQAKKGEKLSTFMEGMFGEVLPYWVLINAMTKAPYQVIGGLKKAGAETASKFKKALLAPVRAAGKVLGMGLAGKLTPKMGMDDAEKLFKDTTNKSKSKALQEFSELSRKIQQGRGGPKGMISRVMSGDLKFWKGASPTHKALKKLFKSNVSLTKRIATRLVNFTGGAGRFLLVAFGIMPFVGDNLVKISHKLFGKPSDSEYGEEKTAEKQVQAEQTSQSTRQESSKIPLVSKYMEQIKDDNPYNTQVKRPNTQEKSLPLVKKYVNKIKNNSNMVIPSREIRNNTPVSTLGGQKDYSVVPDPINSGSVSSFKVNSVISDVDKTLADANNALRGM